MAQKQIKVTLVRSVIGTKQSHRDTVRGLGLGRINDIDVQALKAAGVIGQAVRYAKVIKSGELSRKVVLKGITATAGARAAIEAAGGSLA